MLTTKVQLETNTKNSQHVYQCAPNTPTEEVIEALSNLRTFAFGRLKEQQEQQEKQKASENVEPKPES